MKSNAHCVRRSRVNRRQRQCPSFHTAAVFLASQIFLKTVGDADVCEIKDMFLPDVS